MLPPEMAFGPTPWLRFTMLSDLDSDTPWYPCDATLEPLWNLSRGEPLRLSGRQAKISKLFNELWLAVKDLKR